MRILGIDPGLQVCGYACIEAAAGRENLLEAGVVKTVRGEELAEKLNRIAKEDDRAYAAGRAFRRVLDKLQSNR